MKHLRKREVVFGVIIFFVATLSFGLGFIMEKQSNHASIVIQECGDGFAH